MELLIFEKSRPGRRAYSLPPLDVPECPPEDLLPRNLLRQQPAELPEVSEPELLRHYVRLSQLNYSVDTGFYPLGSCTMKYNPKLNERIAAFDGFQHVHPLQPEETVQGILQLMHELEEVLKTITGLSGVSLQPAAGAQGELTGVLMIRAYHHDRGEAQRRKILIPDSAHGTNPASAAIAGFEVVTIRSNAAGRIDVADLEAHLDDDVAALMLTNPNTLGIFEREVLSIERLVHEAGALFYMDGANLNALVGLVRPGDMGVDCLHINLHKTFSTPHGGGGPGAGPVCVSERLVPYLPIPRIFFRDGQYRLEWNAPKTIGRVHSFFGNVGMFVRAYAYIRMLGAKGLQQVSRDAIVNANYLLSRVRHVYQQLYPETPMHEFVVSAASFKRFGVRTMDIAKRLLDYGFHAPTVYFPLIAPEAMLIEPTETETKHTLDAFADALLMIAREAETTPEILRSAPHNTPVRRLN
ncbi:MAG: aminomethyl-transferring glycine dehydrogenase subunit GcvPB, partial [Candidatus Kapabacteria bacterium]|nr:aminomethyl-transferring glycine dehydrogenase subunit GcvPB [Candidatus Kapabacteria bacterium]MDW7996811.1 aminomethyl-transferring glycine dehydrogenase subunit GcvPB [Bacteroidota bacterium]